MQRQFYVYVLKRPDGTPFYVGKGHGRRALLHEWHARRGIVINPYKHAVIMKILAANKNIIVEVVRRFYKEDSAFDYERKLIAEIGRKPNGPLTNLTDGGDGSAGIVPTAEARANMSAASLGKAKSKTHCKNISKGLRTSAAHKEYTSRPKSAETRAKLAAIHTGRKRPMETRLKIAAANRGRPVSEATRQKVAASVARYYAEKKRV